jgi:hypothetical protein
MNLATEDPQAAALGDLQRRVRRHGVVMNGAGIVLVAALSAAGTWFVMRRNQYLPSHGQKQQGS